MGGVSVEAAWLAKPFASASTVTSIPLNGFDVNQRSFARTRSGSRRGALPANAACRCHVPYWRQAFQKPRNCVRDNSVWRTCPFTRRSRHKSKWPGCRSTEAHREAFAGAAPRAASSIMSRPGSTNRRPAATRPTCRSRCAWRWRRKASNIGETEKRVDLRLHRATD